MKRICTRFPNWPTPAPSDNAAMVMIIDVASKAVKSADQKRYEFLDRFYKNN